MHVDLVYDIGTLQHHAAATEDVLLVLGPDPTRDAEAGWGRVLTIATTDEGRLAFPDGVVTVMAELQACWHQRRLTIWDRSGVGLGHAMVLGLAPWIRAQVPDGLAAQPTGAADQLAFLVRTYTRAHLPTGLAATRGIVPDYAKGTAVAARVVIAALRGVVLVGISQSPAGLEAPQPVVVMVSAVAMVLVQRRARHLYRAFDLPAFTETAGALVLHALAAILLLGALWEGLPTATALGFFGGASVLTALLETWVFPAHVAPTPRPGRPG